MRIAGSIRVLAVIHLLAGSGACLATPPDPEGDPEGDREGDPEGDPGAGDGGPVASVCGNARVDVAHISRFAVQPDDYGYAEMRLVGLVINSGAGLLDVGALDIIDSSVDDDLSVLAFGTFDQDGPPIQPGEARGELSTGGRDLVLARVTEEWTDPGAPELSGLLTTARTSGILRGNVVVGLGPHRVSLDLVLDLENLGGPGVVPQAASRASSTCAEGS